MKRSELFLTFLLVPLDFLAVVAAGVSAYYIRFAKFTTDIRPVIFDLELAYYLQIVLAVAALWMPIFVLAGLYRIKGYRRFINESNRVFLACSTGFVLVVILIFMRRELFDSRFIVLAGYLLSIIYLIIARGLVRGLQKYLLTKGVGVHRVVMVGNSKTTDILVHAFSSKQVPGYDIARRLKDFSIEASQELADFISHTPIDELIQSDPNLPKTDVIRMYDFADDHHLTFKYAADLLGTKVLKSEVSEIAGIPVVEIKKTPLDGWGRIIKRIFDIVVSFILILLLSPVLLVVALVIKLDSQGPVFFSRRDDGTPLYRVGQGGKLIRYFKFRSMIPNADSMRYNELSDRNLRKDGPMVKIQDDPRITRVGRFIRRYSIDELPELFLVLRGDVSLVGPRPHLPEEVAKYEHHHKKVLTIKPGITGLAQVSGRSDLTFEEEVKLDTFYIENWTLGMDISILFRTPFALIKSRHAE